MRAVLYCRLSDSDDASTSIARQEADLRARAEIEGAEVVAVLKDDGVSGAIERANAQAALAMLRDGKADMLLVWKFDRWSRQGLTALALLIETLDAVPSAVFIAHQDGLVSTQPAWRIIASVLAEVARMERENIKARVTSSIAGLRKSGRFAGGNVPYGYSPAPNPDGPGRILIIDDTEAAIVREAAERVLRGETLYKVSHDFNARGIPTRKGGPWSVQAALQMLRSDVIIGRVKHKGDWLRGDDGLPLTIWEPVLDLDVHARVKAQLDRPGLAEPRKKRSRLLSGLVRCGHCNANMNVAYSGTKVTYSCGSRGAGRPCPGVSIMAEPLEGYVTDEWLLGFMGDEEWTERVERAADRTELAEVERALRDTTAAMLTDDADISKLAGQVKSLRERRTELRAMPNRVTVEYVNTGMTVAEHWAAADLVERQRMLRVAFSAVVVTKGTPRRKPGIDRTRVKVKWAQGWRVIEGDVL